MAPICVTQTISEPFARGKTGNFNGDFVTVAYNAHPGPLGSALPRTPRSISTSPRRTWNVLDAINSFNGEVNSACFATAVGYHQRSCTMSDTRLWCGFTTAARPDILSSYSTYVSEAVASWTAKGAMISVLVTSCPVTWGKYNMADREWQRIAGAHAKCYLAAQTQAQTQTQSQSQTGTETPAPSVTAGDAAAWTTSGTSKANNLLGLGGTGRALVLVSVGLAIFANA